MSGSQSNAMTGWDFITKCSALIKAGHSEAQDALSVIWSVILTSGKTSSSYDQYYCNTGSQKDEQRTFDDLSARCRHVDDS